MLCMQVVDEEVHQQKGQDPKSKHSRCTITVVGRTQDALAHVAFAIIVLDTCCPPGLQHKSFLAALVAIISAAAIGALFHQFYPYPPARMPTEIDAAEMPKASGRVYQGCSHANHALVAHQSPSLIDRQDPG